MMVEQSVNVAWQTRYPRPMIRVNRISRQGGQRLGRLKLDAETAIELGTDQVGLFVGGCQKLDRVVDRIREIDGHGDGGYWVVIAASKTQAADLYRLWHATEDCWHINSTNCPDSWAGKNTLFCRIETLRDVLPRCRDSESGVAGILVLDLDCTLHKQRGSNRHGYRVPYDRPQLIVNFRAKLAVGAWSPPLILFSRRPPMADPTDVIQRVYCLEALRFLDFNSMNCDCGVVGV